MRVINKKTPRTIKKRSPASRAKAVKKYIHNAAEKASAVDADTATDSRISVEYPREAFELLSKLPKGSVDCYQAEDDGL